MTKKNPDCPRCGRIDGHYLGCKNSPRPGEVVIDAFEPQPGDRLLRLQDPCETEGCSNFRVGRKFCADCATPEAQRLRAAEKKKENAQ